MTPAQLTALVQLHVAIHTPKGARHAAPAEPTPGTVGDLLVLKSMPRG